MVRVSMVTLVTGATGLVGNAIVRSLVERRREVRVLARTPDKARRLVPEGVDVVRGDVTEGDSLKRAFEGVSVAYHAAGLPEQWLPDEGTFDRVNVEGTANMIEAALAANVKRFVHTSTIDVFRAALGEEYDESVIDPEPKGTAYERSKQAADRAVVKALSRGLPAVFLHPAAVYGDGPAGSPGLNDFVDKLVKRQAPALLPGGMPVVHSDDVGEAHVRAEERAEVGARFILSERYATLEDIARIVHELRGVPVPRTLPLSVAKLASRATELVASITKKPPLIPRGQLEFMQWQARPKSTRSRAELGIDFLPLPDGIARLLGSEV